MCAFSYLVRQLLTRRAMQNAKRVSGLILGGVLLSIVAGCASSGGGAATETGGQTAEAEGELSTLSARVATDYAANYESVRRDALGWFGTTHNGCVAFASTAINRALTPAAHFAGDNHARYVPRGFQLNGGDVSTWTNAFSTYLEQWHSWKRVNNASELEPGDAVFTLPHEVANHPRHTFIFHSWDDRARGVANVLDNQVRGVHRRDVSRNASAARRFWYALRAPQQAPTSAPDTRTACTEDVDCYGTADPGTERNVCSGGFCIDACHSDADCANGDTCAKTLPHYTCEGTNG